MDSNKRLGNMRNTKSLYLWVIVLLGFLFLLNIFSMIQISETSDERLHIEYGKRILQCNPARWKNDHDSLMPFSCFNVIPWRIGHILENIITSKKVFDFLYSLNTARYITVLFSLVLGLYIFKWSKELYGVIPGLFSLILYVFSPNIIAHSRLVTTDFYAACMTTIALYYFWKFNTHGGWQKATISACTLSMSQLAKYTCVLLYPIIALLLVTRYAKEIWMLVKTRQGNQLVRKSMSFGKYVFLFIAIHIIIINIGFCFNTPFLPFGDYSFKSAFFTFIQTHIPILQYVPVSVPYPYLQGLDWVISTVENGFDDIYLLGEWRRIDEDNYALFKSYFFYTFLFKVPLSIQLFFLFSFIGYIFNWRKSHFFKDELFLLLPIGFFIIYFSFFFSVQIGIRYFIVFFPLIHVFCGRLVTGWERWGIKKKGIILGLLFYYIGSVLSYFPYYIPYFNELVWDRKQAYKFLVDSNIEWSNGYLALEKYKKKYPDTIENPDKPVAGRIVVNVNALAGLFDREQYAWLRDNFKPIDHIAYAYLVYEITPEELTKQLKGTF